MLTLVAKEQSLFFVPYENNSIRGVQLLLLVLGLRSANLDCAAERTGGKQFKVLLRDLVRATEELSFLDVMNASQSVPTYSITLLLPLRFLFLKLKLVTGFAHSQRNKHANGGCVLRVCV